MGRIIIKANREDDLYGEYSTVADNFTWIGPRTELLDFLVEDYRPDTDRYAFERSEAEKRVARADETGTSSLIGQGSWDQQLIIMNNQPSKNGTLPREKVAEFLRRLVDESPTDDLLDDFEED